MCTYHVIFTNGQHEIIDEQYHDNEAMMEQAELLLLFKDEISVVGFFDAEGEYVGEETDMQALYNSIEANYESRKAHKEYELLVVDTDDDLPF